MADNLNYSTLTFSPEQSNVPFKVTRRDTKYANIAYQPQPVPRPRAHSLDRRKVNVLSDQSPDFNPDATYDTPPPPIPLRKESTEEVEQTDPIDGLNVDTFADDVTDTKSKDPFSAEDPFASTQQEEWDDDDPSAFYDRPPLRKPIPSDVDPSAFYDRPLQRKPVPSDVGPPPKKIDPEEQLSDTESSLVPVEDNSADFTGGSTYEDATEFLISAQLRAKLSKQGTEPPSNESHLFHPASEVYENVSQDHSKENTPEYDILPVGLFETHPSSNKEEEATTVPGSGPYDYPAALTLHPYKENAPEEPPMQTLSYATKTGGHMIGRQVTNSDQSRHTPRHDMPLPPLPVDQPRLLSTRPQSDYPPPPLPARPPSMKQHSKDAVEPPPLPPMNFPRKTAPQDDNPPLPPRGHKHTPSANGRQSSPTPPAHEIGARMSGSGGASMREDAIMELVALGYSRSDVVRALAISKNDSQLAKMILQEFGGRS